MGIFSMIARAVTRRGSTISPEPVAPFTRDDLTDENRARVAAAAAEALREDLKAGREPHSRDFTVRLADGRVVKVKGISAADPVVTDGRHFLTITKRRGGPSLLPGGMKDKAGRRVETPKAAALRELREEAGYQVPPGSRIELMGTPRVNPRDIRFYDPQHDRTGALAAAYGLKPGDAFIMDSIGIRIGVDRNLSTLEIVPKGTSLTDEQKERQARSLLLQAGDDANTVGIVLARDAALLALQGRIGLSEHYRMMHDALPGIVPAPEALEGFKTGNVMLVLDQKRLAELIATHPEAVPVVKQGLVPILMPKPERLRELAGGREIVGVAHLTTQGKERLIQGEPYAAALNPALQGTGPSAEVVFNANVMKDRATLDKNYDMSRGHTHEEAVRSGQHVQGDPAVVSRVLDGRAFLHVRSADGGVDKIPLKQSDCVIAWHPANAENPRRVMLIPEGVRALLPKAGWGSAQLLEAPGLAVANGPADGYRDEAGLDPRVSLLATAGDGARVSDLAAQGKIPTLSLADVARVAYTADEMRALPGAQPEGQPPVLTKSLLRDAIAQLTDGQREAVHNGLVLAGAPGLAAWDMKLGLVAEAFLKTLNGAYPGSRDPSGMPASSSRRVGDLTDLHPYDEGDRSGASRPGRIARACRRILRQATK